MKKLTSERLGREGLAAWEDRKSTADPEIAAEAKNAGQAPDVSVEDANAEPEAGVGAEQAESDEEAQPQYGTKSRFRNALPFRSAREEAGNVCDRCGFRGLQEGDAVQGDIPALADQQLSKQAAGDVLPSLLESAETEVPDNVEHRGSQPEGRRCEKVNRAKIIELCWCYVEYVVTIVQDR